METRDGRLSRNLALAIGQNEVDTTSERIKFTVNNTIKNGGLVWGKTNLGLGYKIEEVNGKNQIVKDPETAPMVEDFYRYIFLHQNKMCIRDRLHISHLSPTTSFSSFPPWKYNWAAPSVF